MKFRLGRTSIAWLVIAMAMFVGAIALTMMITGAEGGTLQRGLADGGRVPYFTVGVYLADPSPDLVDEYLVTYDEDSNGRTGRIFFTVPPNGRPTLLVGQLTSMTACSGGPGETPPGVPSFTIEKFADRIDDPIYRIVPYPSPQREDIICDVYVGSRVDTYTTRLMNLLSYTPLFSLEESEYVRPDEPGKIPELTAARLAPLQPLPALKVEFPHIPGARNMRFVSNQPVDDLEVGATWRLIRPGEFVQVGWEDEYRKQVRDILLIVIGTLIGIGVTVMIEGVRPLIDSLGGNEPGNPRPRRRPPASKAQPAQPISRKNDAPPPAPSGPGSP